MYSAEYIPAFTYTGRYQVLDDGNENWRIKFLTSGTLIFNDLNSAENGIDLFLVGGGASGSRGSQEEDDDDGAGGGGGGGGYTLTIKNKIILSNTAYPIVIGAGGSWNASMGDNAGNGGPSSAFGHSAAGGKVGWHNTSSQLYPSRHVGGNGGSGGGGGGSASGNAGAGGTNGNNGNPGVYYDKGIGQHTTTREFGEPTGTIYAGGGGGGACYGWDPGGVGGPGGGHGASGWCVGGSGATSGSPNTGSGGGGGGNQPSNVNGVGAGGSGIVIIRNKR